MSEELRIIAVPPEMVDAVWPDAMPMLRGAINVTPDKADIDAVRYGIAEGMYLLWVVMDKDGIIAALTTRIMEYPKRRAMAIDWVGGRRMKEWLPMVLDAMMQHARHNGCKHMEGYGRLAWMRHLGKHGWAQEYVAMRMDVPDQKEMTHG